MKIIAELPKVDINAALDLIGRDFKFDHAKGIAEWLKNSVDAYNLQGTPDVSQIIVIALGIGSNDYVREINVIDFVGMSKAKIDEAFKHWFSPTAAKVTNEAVLSQIRTYGGHGNGGKFYMREMFRNSHAITYLNGKLNGFGFNEKKQYGYSKDLMDWHVEPAEAFQITRLREWSIPEECLRGITEGSHGFTIIQGIGPKKSPGTNYKIQLLDKLLQNPQARRLIGHKKIFMQFLPDERLIQLRAPKIEPKAGFETPVTLYCPEVLEIHGQKVRMVNKNYREPIVLTLYTSTEPLKGQKFRGLNAIDFLGEIGVIASYQMHELGIFTTGFTDFIYGECVCPIMEDKEEDCVRNDREKFVETPRSIALRSWVQACVSELASKMENKHREQRRKRDLKQTSDFNKILNTWKDHFIKRMLRTQLSGLGEEAGIGGDDREQAVVGDQKGKGTGKRGRKMTGETGGSSVKKSPASPSVLISGHDRDPLSEDESTFECDPRHPAVHQRPMDVPHGIYWINTSKPMAGLILDREGADSPQWRSYLFHRYVDIIIKEAIFQMGKKELTLSADEVNRTIDDIVSSVLDKAVEDLKEFLFETGYKP